MVLWEGPDRSSQACSFSKALGPPELQIGRPSPLDR